jgi:hypothetical protein
LRFLVGLGVALSLCAGAPIALAQDGAIPPAKDTIFARKIVMGTIDMNMDEVETMLAPGGKPDPVEAREHLDIISVLLMAFPHLFPAASNQGRKAPIATPRSIPSPRPSSGAALATSTSARPPHRSSPSRPAAPRERATSKTLVADLRTACNACHASYLKTQ